MAADYANPISASEKTCQDGMNCDTFKLTISGTPADWAGKSVHIQIDWLIPAFDYALSVHKGTNADPVDSISDNPVDSPRNWEAVDIDPSVSGVGDYSVHVIYFTTRRQTLQRDSEYPERRRSRPLLRPSPPSRRRATSTITRQRDWAPVRASLRSASIQNR